MSPLSFNKKNKTYLNAFINSDWDFFWEKNSKIL